MYFIDHILRINNIFIGQQLNKIFLFQIAINISWYIPSFTRYHKFFSPISFLFH